MTPGLSNGALSVLENIHLVLVEPRDPINVGTAVRALKNMGLSRLVLVNPVNPDRELMRISAPKADDVIDNVTIVPSIDGYLDDADVRYVAATTARPRRDKRMVAKPREHAQTLVREAHDGPVAVLFGREDRGLTNAEVDRADVVLHIPTQPEYASLNLGQAVLVIAYEIWLAASNGGTPLPRPKRDFPRARHAEVDAMLRHLEQELSDRDFFRTGAQTEVMLALASVFSRASVDEREVRILRGVVSSLAQPPQGTPES